MNSLRFTLKVNVVIFITRKLTLLFHPTGGTNIFDGDYSKITGSNNIKLSKAIHKSSFEVRVFFINMIKDIVYKLVKIAC